MRASMILVEFVGVFVVIPCGRKRITVEKKPTGNVHTNICMFLSGNLQFYPADREVFGYLVGYKNRQVPFARPYREE